MMSTNISDHETVEEKSPDTSPEKSHEKSPEKSHEKSHEKSETADNSDDEEIDVDRVKRTMCRLTEASEYATKSCMDDLKVRKTSLLVIYVTRIVTTAEVYQKYIHHAMINSIRYAIYENRTSIHPSIHPSNMLSI